MKASVDKKAEDIIKLFPGIINTLGKIDQGRSYISFSGRYGPGRNGRKDDRVNPITFNQYLTLILIKDTGKCSVNELAAKLKIAQSTASQLVDRLVRAGYVQRYSDSKDRRRQVVSLDRSGNDVINKHTNTLKINFVKILSLLNKKELQMLEEVVTSLHRISIMIDGKLKAQDNSIIRNKGRSL